jgi:hypothetical protein
MPVNKNTKPAEFMSNSTKRRRSSHAARTSDRKAAGTRVGTLDDWREGGAKGRAEASSARRNRLRDGS